MAEELSVFSLQSQSFQQVMTVYATIFLLYAFPDLKTNKQKKKKKKTPYVVQSVWAVGMRIVFAGIGLITVLSCG